jgi:hypothetical protein
MIKKVPDEDFKEKTGTITNIDTNAREIEITEDMNRVNIHLKFHYESIGDFSGLKKCGIKKPWQLNKLIGKKASVKKEKITIEQ